MRDRPDRLDRRELLRRLARLAKLLRAIAEDLDELVDQQLPPADPQRKDETP